jgi:hypothetical protein
MNLIFSGGLALLQLMGTLLFTYYGWTLVVAYLMYLIWQNRRRQTWVGESEPVLLLVEVPRENERKELSAEQMFASLHGMLRPKAELIKEGSLQEHIGFEIVSMGSKIQFFVWTPRHLKDFVEGQIYAQYPDVVIQEGVDDYARRELTHPVTLGTELVLTKDDVYPIKTFETFEVDPLAGITAILAKLEGNEEMWVQILARPVDDSWHKKGLNAVNRLKSGKAKTFGDALLDLPLHIFANLFRGLVAPPEEKKKDDKKKDDDKMSTGQKALVGAIEDKAALLGYEVRIRLAYLGSDQTLARQRLQSILGGFKQFNTTNLNGFAPAKFSDSSDFIDQYRSRFFFSHGYILNIKELASLYHLPHKNVATPNIAWTSTKASEPPGSLPTESNTPAEELSLFGVTNFRSQKVKFGIKRGDRGRHLYIIGQTGTGKSFLLQLLILSDLYQNFGLAVVDPHGDLATDIMKYIPEHRLKDVIYFNPADTNYPIAFNPMEVLDPNFKNNTSSELVGVLKRMFESWGPRLEYILRFTILALLDYPDSTMLGITRMLTDKEYRKKVVREIQDPVVKNFWLNEFASWNDKFANEAVAPVLNKVGAFTANPLIRNVVGQPKSSLNLRQIMDEGKILIVNLSQGLVGEDNANVLGALMVTKIQLAAMSRANVALADRRPFYLYVDEFQNFATDTFAVILSEARKYGLYLTVANQYIAQMPDTVREAVFGNVGSMATFRIGAGDATFLAKYFEPAFEAADLVKLHNQDVFINMSIDGEKTVPFSGRTLKMPPAEHDLSAQIIEQSRASFARSRTEVEAAINQWSYDAHQSDKKLGEERVPAGVSAGTAAAGGAPAEGEVKIFGSSFHHEQEANILSSLKNPEPRPQPAGGGQGNRPRDNRPLHHQGHQRGEARLNPKPEPKK